MIYSPVEAQIKAIKAAQAGKEPTSILQNAANKALSGGLAGAGAMVVQVSTLMWMRTTMNYQYRYGTTTKEALKHLYKDGGGGVRGVLRFYKGFTPALLQGPLSRFGDTAANTGALALLDSYESTKGLPVGVKTIAASISAALFRIVLMPVDCLKTTMQVEGAKGVPMLMKKIGTFGPQVLWHGSIASASATFVGHYPWFFVNNMMNSYLSAPKDFMPYLNNVFLQTLAHRAVVGFCSSAASDTLSNSIRVIKTVKQTHPDNVSMREAVNMVIQKDGVAGLFGRGLQTRIMANGVQGIMFNIMWRYGMDYFAAQEKLKKAAAEK
mmetsp:Transcript_48658/g.41093  ORF Transcript_48658/g.41093 Transcript_48658/m.41093 type:complete len:324 (-) Transcript_48658:105-1076(-)